MTDGPEKTFHVIRQDSNGNHFLERENIGEKLADEFLKARIEEIGDHHQTIWKQDSTLPLPSPIHR